MLVIIVIALYQKKNDSKKRAYAHHLKKNITLPVSKVIDVPLLHK